MLQKSQTDSILYPQNIDFFYNKLTCVFNMLHIKFNKAKQYVFNSLLVTNFVLLTLGFVNLQ